MNNYGRFNFKGRSSAGESKGRRDKYTEAAYGVSDDRDEE
ncbi:hypothetical protein COEU31_07270 [Coprococcus eutactus]|uniref:Uncharacterized protein n=1 Tax=Coprococcus eutactus TaxID=33043 RepID=A0AAI9K3W8_9FIRM|nr:hypothetical protein COEU31_07270 [Coprococcus eutactus]